MGLLAVQSFVCALEAPSAQQYNLGQVLPSIGGLTFYSELNYQVCLKRARGFRARDPRRSSRPNLLFVTGKKFRT